MESAIIAIIISLIIGAVAYFVTRSNLPTGTIKVSKREFIIGSVISVLVLLVVGPITEKLIVDGKEQYYEYFNGYETAATIQVTKCDRDGDCDNTYNCDPYLVVHTYEDSKGHEHTYVTTEYHRCPYLTQELHYTVSTTLGDYPIGGSFADKQRAAWRSSEAVPASVVTGPPLLWAQAKARLDAGKPGGVTKVHQYKNFLLASDQTILKQYSADIDQYKKRGLLPPHTVNYANPIHDEYLADKFTVIKLNTNIQPWNEALMRLNGYLGKDLQGDIHMTAVNASLVTDQDDYSQALFAYWKDPQSFQKYALSKNAIGIVLGVSNSKIVWARAIGGLPVGNEGLFTDIQNNLVGVAFSPDAVIGIPKKTPGVLTQTLYGAHKFKRPCMECIGKGAGGYAYLKSDIYVTGGQRFWIIFISTILSCIMWTIFLYTDDNLRNIYY